MRRRQAYAIKKPEIVLSYPAEVKEEVNPLKCLICGFVAKSNAGLAAHMANREDHRGKG